MRAPVKFYDQIGWQKPLPMAEPAPEDYAKPGGWFKVTLLDDDE